MSGPRNPERLSAWILAGIAIAEGWWVVENFVYNPRELLAFLGFTLGRSGNATGWFLAVLVTGSFVWASVRLPAVRANLFRPSFLKLLALAVAVTAGILEEVIFRKWLMDYLRARAIGPVVQVLGSGLLFGLAHGVWGLLGRSLRAAASATIATGLLGTALAVVYVMSGRSLAPCIATHFLINALLEPGLVLAAMSGQMGKWENVHK
jgi:membrane protease YdiL (CAAX protease family)